MTPEEALKKAVEACGSEAELARRIGLTAQAINQWTVAPVRRVLEIEKATDGQVSRQQLCPDMYPAEQTERAA
jgi:DNA-binding transcriptional regulator YdaS (Cro superfamily)